MNSFALVWGKLIHSSIWVKESKETRLVWITMLVMKDHAGQVHSSVVGLADAAKVSVEECRMALEVLLSPDLDDTSGVEEGRRIRVIPGGWEVINHDLYRFSTDSKREFWRQQKAEYRARKNLKIPKGPLKGESAHVAAENGGASREQLDHIISESLPKTTERVEWE